MPMLQHSPHCAESLLLRLPPAARQAPRRRPGPEKGPGGVARQRPVDSARTEAEQDNPAISVQALIRNSSTGDHMQPDPHLHDREEHARKSVKLSGHDSREVPTILGSDWRRYLLTLLTASR